MPILYAPYHLDEHLPDLRPALPEGADVRETAADLPDADMWARLVRLHDRFADDAAAAAADGPVLAVTGDCTLSIGLAAGLQRAGTDPAVVWIDAHGDLQTLETTASGYVGGMALRFLHGYRPDLFAEPLRLRPVGEDRTLLLDGRDLDPPEADHIAATAIRHRPLDGLTAADLPEGPLLVNLDLDTLDPETMPGARYPAPDGPDEALVLQALRTITGTGRVAGLNIACTWEPGPAAPAALPARLIAAAVDALG